MSDELNKRTGELNEDQTFLQPRSARFISAYKAVTASVVSMILLTLVATQAMSTLDGITLAIALLAHAAYGARAYSVAVVVSRSHIVIRNRFQTRTVEIADIQALRFEARWSFWRCASSQASERYVGVLHRSDGTSIELLATESFKVPLLRWLTSQKPSVAEDLHQRICEAVGYRPPESKIPIST